MAVDKIVGFTEDDYQVITDLVEQHRRRYNNPLQRTRDLAREIEDMVRAPEVYVALPSDGIPPVGREPGTSTSTGSMAQESPIFSGRCSIYRILYDDATGTGTVITQGTLVPIGADAEVWNLSDSFIEPGQWILAVRDKFGSWIAIPTVSGATQVSYVKLVGGPFGIPPVYDCDLALLQANMPGFTISIPIWVWFFMRESEMGTGSFSHFAEPVPGNYYLALRNGGVYSPQHVTGTATVGGDVRPLYTAIGPWVVGGGDCAPGTAGGIRLRTY